MDMHFHRFLTLPVKLLCQEFPSKGPLIHCIIKKRHFPLQDDVFQQTEKHKSKYLFSYKSNLMAQRKMWFFHVLKFSVNLTNIFENIKNKDKAILNNLQAKNTSLLSNICREEEP